MGRRPHTTTDWSSHIQRGSEIFRMGPSCKPAASFFPTGDRPVQPSHTTGCSPGYLLPISRCFGCRSKSGGTSSNHLHANKMDGSFSKTSRAHAGKSTTTILRAI
ncbi:hypothetical protein PHET_11344, partial [Paragonimus heterotremus]